MCNSSVDESIHSSINLPNARHCTAMRIVINSRSRRTYTCGLFIIYFGCHHLYCLTDAPRTTPNVATAQQAIAVQIMFYWHSVCVCMNVRVSGLQDFNGVFDC